jgi:hypothetical protein
MPRRPSPHHLAYEPALHAVRSPIPTTCGSYQVPLQPVGSIVHDAKNAHAEREASMSPFSSLFSHGAISQPRWSDLIHEIGVSTSTAAIDHAPRTRMHRIAQIGSWLEHRRSSTGDRRSCLSSSAEGRVAEMTHSGHRAFGRPGCRKNLQQPLSRAWHQGGEK